MSLNLVRIGLILGRCTAYSMFFRRRCPNVIHILFVIGGLFLSLFIIRKMKYLYDSNQKYHRLESYKQYVSTMALHVDFQIFCCFIFVTGHKVNSGLIPGQIMHFWRKGLSWIHFSLWSFVSAVYYSFFTSNNLISRTMSTIFHTICVNACIFSYKLIPQVVVLLNVLNPTMNLSKRLESTFFNGNVQWVG